ncbi:hypothetical protein [Thorsellia kenyensis]|uniref:Uncharacterized protein n=1 Tax=Thorsellia kenyensis TaxID=1549888 RepID=A0ABV6CB63_9GAMM
MYSWGLLAPEQLSSFRRKRSLGLNAVIQDYNEKAVPGVASIWYAKQVLICVLGIVVAERVNQSSKKRVSNIEVTNAIEALAFKISMLSNSNQGDARIRGITKLANKEEELFTYKEVTKKGFYLVQPMRMSIGQALLSLEFAKSGSTRFNTFSPTDLAKEFIDKEDTENMLNTLVNWVAVGSEPFKNLKAKKNQLLNVLQPLSNSARLFLKDVLNRNTMSSFQHDPRRKNVLKWVEHLKKNPQKIDLGKDTNEFLSVEHWKHIKQATHFNELKITALAILNNIERFIGNKESSGIKIETLLTNQLNDLITLLSEGAKKFLKNENIHKDAKNFCLECIQITSNQEKITFIKRLIERDNSTLVISGDLVKPGEAFEVKMVNDDQPQEQDEFKYGIFPNYIPYRLINMYLLNLDFANELTDKLKDEAN